MRTSWFSPAARINRWLRRHERHADILCSIGSPFIGSSFMPWYEGMRDTYRRALRILAEDPDPSFRKTGAWAFAFAAWAHDHPLKLGGFHYSFGVWDAGTRLGRWCARHARAAGRKKGKEAVMGLLPLLDTIDELHKIEDNLIYLPDEYSDKIQLHEDAMQACFAVDDLIVALRRFNADLLVAHDPIPGALPEPDFGPVRKHEWKGLDV